MEPTHIKTFCIDIDGTICSFTTNHRYDLAEPDLDMIRMVNDLYDAGHYIKMHTARGMASGMEFTEITKKQLKEWGVKYHELIMNKPMADYYVDDKACLPGNFKNIYNLWMI
jgi:hypothetical protein